VSAALVLHTLKTVRLGLDEDTARQLRSELETVEYVSFVDALDYDPQLRRWVNSSLPSTSLSALSRNLQLSPSNTCLQPRPPSPALSPEPSTPSALTTTLYFLARAKLLTVSGVEYQHGLMLRSAFEQESEKGTMDVEQFREFCGRYQGNPIVHFGEDIVKTLISEGKVTIAALDTLLAALKYSKPMLKGNIEQNTGPRPPPVLSRLLERLSFRLMQRYSSLPAAFRKFDRDQDGLISYTDFTESLRDLNLDFSPAEVREIFTQLGGPNALSYTHFASIKGDPVFPQFEESLKGRTAKDRKVTSSESPNRLYFGSGRRSPHSNLPSQANPDHCYGLKTPFSDDISEVMQNSFEREYLDRLRKRQEMYQRREKAQSRAPTNSERLRNAAIRKKLEGEKGKSKWKMPKFEQKEAFRREKETRERPQNSHL